MVVDFKPGDSIAGYLSYFVYASAGATARGVTDVEQLSTSMCRRISGDKMSCTSCHDLHYSPAASERVALYRGKCLACHSAPAFTTSHHPENPDCTSCHMPRSTAQNIPHVAWTDHRILRQPGAESPAFNRNEDVIGLARDLTAVECLLGDGAAARTTLETTLAYSPGSKDVLDRLQQTASCSTGRK